MAQVTINCQLCCRGFGTVHGLKNHLCSEAHGQKYMSIFCEEKTPVGYVFFPNIIFADYRQYDFRKPHVGISLLTLCYGETTTFYLCHVCEMTCRTQTIIHHLSSGDHYINYFNYTDPNMLTFSWTTGMDMKLLLKPQVIRELKRKRSEALQILTLPLRLLKRMKNCSYSEVMNILGENKILLKLLEADKPQRNTFQMYQKDENRKHPLLGMQHIVEFMCDGQPEKRHYLCTLCKLTVGNNMILRHLLSFDHVYCYLKATQPSTMLSKYSYFYSKSITSIMLDLVKQAGEMNSVADTKQVTLDPTEFASLSSIDFAKALKKLESYLGEKSGHGSITDFEHKSSPSADIGDDAAEETSQTMERMEPTSERSDNTGKDIMEGTKEKEMEKMKREDKELILEISEKTKMDMMKERMEKIMEETEELRQEIEEAEERKEVENELEERRITEEMQLDIQAKMIKENEEVITMEHTSEISHSCPSTVKDIEGQSGQESSKGKIAQLRSPVTVEKDIKMSDKQRKMHDSEAAEGGKEPKRKCFSSKKDQFHEESQKIRRSPSGQSHETANMEADNDQKRDLLWEYIKKENREPVIGLHAVLECNFDEHSPIYLCYCCCRRIIEKDIVKHVTGNVHWRKYLAWSERVPVEMLKQKKMISRQLVAYFERCEGHGEAEVIDVDEKSYLAVISQPFTLALQTLWSTFPNVAPVPNKQPTPSATVHPPPEEHLQSSAPSVAVVHTNSSTAMSATSTVNIKPNNRVMEVGKGELIVVRYGKRRQVYCKLCRVRLRDHCHLSNHSHLSNYVKQSFGHDASTATLEKIIPHLVAIENILGTQKGPIVEVTSDVYDALAALCTDEALEKVEMMLQHRIDLQVPSVSTTNNTNKAVLNSCESPCPDDGMLVQPKNSRKEKDVKQLAVPPEVTPDVRAEAAKSCTDTDPGSCDQTPNQFQPCHGIKTEPDRFPILVVENTQNAVPVERLHRTDTVATHTESSSSTVVQTPPTNQETNENRQQHVSVKLEETSLAIVVKVEPPSDDMLKIDQENNPGTDVMAENSSWVGLGPEQQVSQELWNRSSGDGNQIHTSENTVEPETYVIIGRRFVWKCQGPSGDSFYLCESCKETFFTCHIAHMSSPPHWLAYIKWHHPSLLYFWDKEEYPVEVKHRALRKAAIGFSRRENFYHPTLQHVSLGPHLYEHVRAAPFTEALKIVQSILTLGEQPLTSSQSNIPEAPGNLTSSAFPQQTPVSGLEERLAGTHSKSKSVQRPERCQRSLSQEPHKNKSSKTRKRLAHAAAETLTACSNDHHTDSEGPWPAKRTHTRPSTASGSNS